MKEKLKIHEAMVRVLTDLKQENYANFTVGRYRHCYNGLLKFIERNKVEYYSTALAVDYIRHKFGITIDGLYGKHEAHVRSSIRALQFLSDYSEHNVMIIKRRPLKKPFECPGAFKKDYESFKNDCESRNYAQMGKVSLFWSLQKFLMFLKEEGLNSSTEITSVHILKFLTSYKEYSSRYIATTISRVRNYLNFLHQDGITSLDLNKYLPHVRIMRNSFIPSVWEKEDVKKLLESIDRQNPKGKRDYAILLLVTRLGLRVGDIRSLKLSDLNWNRKLISIIMQKTKQPLELPMLDDIGWAIIDYLKNGRPQTISDLVFIRHRAPYDGFADHNCLHKMLVRHMTRAKIHIKDQKHGLHSLRSTLALVLLENGTPLPVISEALGHQNIQTTSIYLKIRHERSSQLCNRSGGGMP